MKAAATTKDGMRIQQHPTPVPGRGQVLVRTVSCGVCEGEVFQYAQLLHTGGDDIFWRGHEGSGVIEQLGPGITGWAVGDVVTTSLGGAYAEYFTVDQSRLVRLPPGVSPHWAVGEAVACCAYSAQNARIQPGNSVAVVGCGFMGLLTLAFARHQYRAGRILAVEPLASRRALALAYGADEAIDPADAPRQAEYDVVIECAGNQVALDIATSLATTHGRLTIVGFHQSGQGMRTVDMKAWNLKALEVTSGHCNRPEEKRRALEGVLPLIANGTVDLQRLVTPYPFEEIDRAFRDVMERREGLVKAAVLF